MDAGYGFDNLSLTSNKDSVTFDPTFGQLLATAGCQLELDGYNNPSVGTEDGRNWAVANCPSDITIPPDDLAAGTVGFLKPDPCTGPDAGPGRVIVAWLVHGPCSIGSLPDGGSRIVCIFPGGACDGYTCLAKRQQEAEADGGAEGGAAAN